MYIHIYVVIRYCLHRTTTVWSRNVLGFTDTSRVISTYTADRQLHILLVVYCIMLYICILIYILTKNKETKQELHYNIYVIKQSKKQKQGSIIHGRGTNLKFIRNAMKPVFLLELKMEGIATYINNICYSLCQWASEEYVVLSRFLLIQSSFQIFSSIFFDFKSVICITKPRSDYLLSFYYSQCLFLKSRFVSCE